MFFLQNTYVFFIWVAILIFQGVAILLRFNIVDTVFLCKFAFRLHCTGF